MGEERAKKSTTTQQLELGGVRAIAKQKRSSVFLTKS